MHDTLVENDNILIVVPIFQFYYDQMFIQMSLKQIVGMFKSGEILKFQKYQKDQNCLTLSRPMDWVFDYISLRR